MVAGLFAFDLGPVWTAWNQLAVENSRTGDYHAAAQYWTDYAARLQRRRDAYAQQRGDMEANASWSRQNAAAGAFYDRVDKGVTSMDAWLQANPQQIGAQLQGVADNLGREFQSVDGHRQWLLRQSTQDPATGALRPITPQDTQVMVPEGTDLGQMDVAISESQAAAQRVITSFQGVMELFGTLPANAQWEGPAVELPPGAPDADHAAPGGPAAAGGSGGAPGGGAPGGSPTGTDPASATGTPSGTPSDTPSGTPGGTDAMSGTDSSATPSSPDSSPGTDSGIDPSGTDLTSSLPASDPSLAGTPASLLDPTSSSPGTSPSLPSPSLSSTFTPSSSSTSVPSSTFTPLALSTGIPSSRGASPVRPIPSGGTGSAVPGSGVTGVGGGNGVEAGPTPARGTPPVEGGGGASGSGFYPPMMPMAPGGGGTGGGVRPGNADSSGGPSLRSGGRDSWRAGLRLQGRSGGNDERASKPAFPPPSGDVLDEELWQVPGQAPPAAPPEPESRRGRSRGF